jgi:hypothetical protein
LLSPQLLNRERKLCKADRELLAKLRPFARHQSQAETEALTNGLLGALACSVSLRRFP